MWFVALFFFIPGRLDMILYMQLYRMRFVADIRSVYGLSWAIVYATRISSFRSVDHLGV